VELLFFSFAIYKSTLCAVRNLGNDEKKVQRNEARQTKQK